jgi:hypothetical protein
VAIVAVALSVIAGATFGLGDRATLVPPPDAVAESFTRELVEERYALAMKFLAWNIASSMTPDELRRLYEPLRAGVGIPEQVEASLETMEEHRAAARTRVKGSEGSAVLQLRFVREDGLWVVSELPAPATTVPLRR